MSVTAFIPARGGSKGLPRKNLARIRGRSLVHIAVEVAAAVHRIDDIVVSSDCPDVLNEADQDGARPLVREEDLAEDMTPTVDVVRAAFADAAAADIVVLLQPTSPLRSADDVERCLMLLEQPSVRSVVTVTAFQHPAEWHCNIDGAGWLSRAVSSDVTRRQDAPTRYYINGAVYAATIGHLRTSSFVGSATKALVMPKRRSVDIDDAIDLELARLLASPVVNP